MRGEKLNPQQELFCQYYATDRECFGSGVKAYIEAYRLDMNNRKNYDTARTNASKLLTNTNITIRINELLEQDGLNDNFVDKELLFLISQHEDKGSKIAAIREYNKLKQRITDKVDVTTKGKELNITNYINLAKDAKSDEELQRIAQEQNRNKREGK